jgi:hypothetical protein
MRLSRRRTGDVCKRNALGGGSASGGSEALPLHVVIAGVFMSRRLVVGVLFAAVASGPSVAAAQGSAERPWGPGTTLSVFAGAASPDTGVAGAAGASLGWELKPYLTIEGAGVWIGETAGQHEFVAMAGPRFSLSAPGRVVPSIFAGVGMLRAAVDTQDPDLPAFYAERVGAAPRQSREVFEDLALAAGAGVDLYFNAHLAMRPDVRLLFVRSDSDHVLVPVFGVHMTYHFEAHPYLPRRSK